MDSDSDSDSDSGPMDSDSHLMDSGLMDSNSDSDLDSGLVDWTHCRTHESGLTPTLTIGTHYPQSLCRNQGGTDTQFCSLPL